MALTLVKALAVEASNKSPRAVPVGQNGELREAASPTPGVVTRVPLAVSAVIVPKVIPSPCHTQIWTYATIEEARVERAPTASSQVSEPLVKE